jgi:hypothetical protein
MAVEKVNTQVQQATEYINIFEIIIQFYFVNLVKGEENMQNKYKQTR